MKRKREWVQIAVRRTLFTSNSTYYFVNGIPYTDLDEPLRLARVRAAAIRKYLRIWKKPNDILLSTYRTSDGWGEPHTEKLPFEKIWPIFEAYARML